MDLNSHLFETNAISAVISFMQIVKEGILEIILLRQL
jgi:hypothetical protein